ncbi:MAG: C1 family peptidase, partial [bacterium]|nr:C1 family peptidase [bacterium]
MASKLKINVLLIFLVMLLLILLAANAAGQEASDFGLIIPAAVQEYWQTHEPDTSEFNSNMLPLALDWSSFDSEVKNQLNCGSCWAFTAVALIENISRKNDLSEQVVISCTAGGCSGGWYGDALKYASDFGVPPEDCYQYLATNGNCDDKCSQPEYLVFLSSYDYYGRWGTPNQSTIGRLKDLLQNGPVCASMLVPADGTFESYSGGVYDYEGGEISSNRGHAILVVGYNENEQYFKAKNSWGSNWGEDGYFRISYDDVTDDVQFGGYACTASG